MTTSRGEARRAERERDGEHTWISTLATLSSSFWNDERTTPVVLGDELLPAVPPTAAQTARPVDVFVLDRRDLSGTRSTCCERCSERRSIIVVVIIIIVSFAAMRTRARRSVASLIASAPFGFVLIAASMTLLTALIVANALLDVLVGNVPRRMGVAAVAREVIEVASGVTIGALRGMVPIKTEIGVVVERSRAPSIRVVTSLAVETELSMCRIRRRAVAGFARGSFGVQEGLVRKARVSPLTGLVTRFAGAADTRVQFTLRCLVTGFAAASNVASQASVREGRRG